MPVILSGGSGKRLWPLSTDATPKQFLSLISERTLFQETLLRLRGLPGLADPLIVCNEAHTHLIAEQLAVIDAHARAIILEPAARDTAPAIAAAALLAREAAPGAAADETPVDPLLLLILPADHILTDAAALRGAVGKATAAAGAGSLVTFGIVPTFPETGYGYIERADSDTDWFPVQRFVEKPDLESAVKYMESGRFYWNSGMFVFSVDSFLAELRRAAPDILAAASASVRSATREGEIVRLGREFLSSPAVSIDYAVMESTDRAAVVPLDAGWSDVGSWAALYEVLDKDDNGNVLKGDVVTLDTTNSLVIPHLRKIAVLGLDNVVVVDAGDKLLVMSKDRSQGVKELLGLLNGESDRS